MSRNLTYHLLNGGRKQWVRSCCTCRSNKPEPPCTLVSLCVLGSIAGTVGGTVCGVQVWQEQDFGGPIRDALMLPPLFILGGACGFVAGGTAPFWIPLYMYFIM